MVTLRRVKPRMQGRIIGQVSILNLTVMYLLCCVFTPYAGAGSVLQSGEKKEGARPLMPDVDVVDQNGKSLRFYTDLVKGKVVAINFIFTSCKYICPMQGENFSRLLAALGEHSGKDIHLISVSIDPSTDTPERLKKWAERFGAKAGWTLVTGDKANMDKLLVALTGDAAGEGEHSPIVFIGDYDKGEWIRSYGLAEPERFVKIFEGLTKSRR